MWIPDPIRLLTATLSRHVLVELTKIFVVALVALTSMFLVGGVVRTALDQGLPLAHVGQLLPYVLPEMLRYTLPVSLLLATVFVYGRMAGSNEVVAVKALGISPLEILSPALIASFLLSLATCYVNDLATSWGRNGIQRVVTESIEDIIYSMLRTQKAYASPMFAISVKGVVDRRLIKPYISIEKHGGSPGGVIIAEEAVLRADPTKNVLKIELRNFYAQFGANSIVYEGVDEQEIPLRDSSQSQAESALPSVQPLNMIPGQIEQQQHEIDNFRQEMAFRAATQVISGNLDDLTNLDWRSQSDNLADKQGRLFRLLTEPHRRWAGGFSCFFFVWVGAPLAMRRRHSDLLSSFFLCFMPILLVYYPLIIYGVDGSKHGTIPPWSVWAGNVLLLLWGTYLLRKVIRY